MWYSKTGKHFDFINENRTSSGALIIHNFAKRYNTGNQLEL